MKLKTILFIILFSSIYSVAFSKNIVKHFEDMPAKQILHLDANMRRLMVKMYFENPDDCAITNFFGGKSQILFVDTLNNHLQLQISEESRLEMKLVSLPDQSQAIAVIRTVCAPICHSYIQFYTNYWKTINPIVLPKICASNWITDNTVQFDGRSINDFIVASFVEISFHPDSDKIIYKNNSLEYLNEEEKILVNEYFREEDIVVELTD